MRWIPIVLAIAAATASAQEQDQWSAARNSATACKQWCDSARMQCRSFTLGECECGPVQYTQAQIRAAHAASGRSDAACYYHCGMHGRAHSRRVGGQCYCALSSDNLARRWLRRRVGSSRNGGGMPERRKRHAKRTAIVLVGRMLRSDPTSKVSATVSVSATSPPVGRRTGTSGLSAHKRGDGSPVKTSKELAALRLYCVAVEIRATLRAQRIRGNGKGSIFDLAERAQAEVDTWPAWKVRAADTALVSNTKRNSR